METKYACCECDTEKCELQILEETADYLMEVSVYELVPPSVNPEAGFYCPECDTFCDVKLVEVNAKS